MRQFTGGVLVGLMLMLLSTVLALFLKSQLQNQQSKIPLEILRSSNYTAIPDHQSEYYTILMKDLGVMKLIVADGVVQSVQAPTSDKGWRTIFSNETSKENVITAEQAQAIFGKILILPGAELSKPKLTLAEPG